ncbi:hypothetical protein ABBQ32_006374 [Trebouxia sp. C0010 RCD-2024]
MGTTAAGDEDPSASCFTRPSDAQLALCSLYANRWYTMKRLLRVSTRLGIKPEMKVWDQFLIRRTGQRMITFVTDVNKLEDGRKVAAAVFAFRGTKLNKAGNLRADLHLLQDLNAEMIVTQRASKKVHDHIKRLQEQFQSVRWSFYTTGHSLGGFTAASCAILNTKIRHSTTFEAPGLTTFYHKLAAESGTESFWDARVTNYVTIPNPINMCQKHLGEVYRVYTRTECRTDMLHIFKCLFGSCVRTLNWLLLANVLITAVRVMMGGVTSYMACADALASQPTWTTFKALLRKECGLEVAVGPAQLVTSAYWTLRGASAFVAGKLGTTVTHVLQQHSMLHMTKAFDFETGLPKRCVKMQSWPLMDRLSRPFWEHLGRAALESFVPTDTTEGLLVMFDRNAMVEARIRCLPDYIEAEQTFPDRKDSLDYLTHNLFDAAEWFGHDPTESLDDHAMLSMDEAATEAEIDSGAEDESALTVQRKSVHRLPSLHQIRQALLADSAVQ